MNTESIKFHVSLHVSNIENTVAFYSQLFDTPPSKIKLDYAKFDLEEPGLVISFIQSTKPKPDFGHLGFSVASKEDLEARREKIAEKLEISLEEKHTDCCYARQSKFWVNDPDGYNWEVYFKEEDVEQNSQKYEAAPCCS